MVFGNAVTALGYGSAPAIATFHSEDQANWRTSYRPMVILSRLGARRAARRIVVSPDSVPILSAFGSTAFIPNGVLAPGWDVVAERSPNGRLVFARRLAPKNGLGLLLRALTAMSPESRPKVDVTAAGDKDAVSRAETQIDECSLRPYVSLVPPYAPHDWQQFLGRYSAAVVPSSWDAVCYGAIEPMSLGMPVVLCRFPGAIPILRELPPRLRLDSEFGDVAALAANLRRALEPELQSSETRRDIWRAAQRFSGAAMVDRTLEVYRQAAGDSANLPV